jgi:coenzyme F420-reducing hydrogenase delta subunit/NAD-dependent dihydropyrimidine dehydrogenase PreA subunit
MELARLKKWEHQLNACIRCGYCYEHCPLYKSTHWESDAPRAKLVLLFGLLNGQVEPTPSVARKLFECFHCKRCEAVCSSGVPFTEILAAARADLQEAGLDVDGITSFNIEGGCAKCLACVRVCKHGARTWDGTRVVVDRAACQGCGACVEACSCQTAQLNHTYGTGEAELVAEISAYLDPAPDGEARAIVFCCNWSSYPGLQNSRIVEERQTPEFQILVNMCAGRLSNRLILEALKRNAWGVLVTGCPEDECEHGGSSRVRRRISALQTLLGDLSIDPRRVRFTEVPRGDPAQLTRAIDVFLDEIRPLGPTFGGIGS